MTEFFPKRMDFISLHPHSTYTPPPLTFPFPNDRVHTTYFHTHVSFTSPLQVFDTPFLPPSNTPILSPL